MGTPPRSVAAITFTEKAAREMRHRIRTTIAAWLARPDLPAEERARWTPILLEVDAARISTIHGLCAAILRAQPAEAGIDPRFEVLDEGLAAVYRAQAANDALDWAADQSSLDPVFAAFDSGTLRDILARLFDKRLAAAAALREPDPLAHWNAAVLVALERWRAAAAPDIAELQQLDAAGLLAADAGEKLAAQVHGLLATWEQCEQALAAGEAVQAARTAFTIRREWLRRSAGKRGSAAAAAVAALQTAYDAGPDAWLGGQKSGSRPPEPQVEALLEDLLPALGRLFVEAERLYRVARDRRGSLDFDDLEFLAATLLADPAIRSRWQRELSAVLVDEFQDTNPRQVQIVEALAGVDEAPPGRLFVVGDAKQSIYRFRDADVTGFGALAASLAARGGRALAIAQTYRAHARLVAALNVLLGTVLGRDGDPARPYAVPFSPLTATRTAPALALDGPPVELLVGRGLDAREARSLAAALLATRLRTLHDQHELGWSQIVLLFAASTHFATYEDALQAAGIPFVTVAGKGFYDRPEIRDLLNALQAIADPWDDLAMAGLLRSPLCGLTDLALYPLRWPDGAADPRPLWQALAGDLGQLPAVDQPRARRARELLAELHPLVERLPVAQLLQRLLLATGYPARLACVPAGPRLQRNVEKLLADAQASGLVRVGDFLDYLRTLREAGVREGEAPPDELGAVRLLTVHKAKGLQFPVVVIADASRRRLARAEPVLLSRELGLIPGPTVDGVRPLVYHLAQTQEREAAAAEDRRLLYVAATRASEKLIVSGHLAPRTGDRHWLGMLAAAAGCDLSSLAPDVWQTAALPDSAGEVAALICERAPAGGPAGPDRARAHAGRGAALFAPLELPAPSGDRLGELRAEAQRPFTPARPSAAVGDLVHAAIASWCFADDPGFEPLLMATALALQLLDPAERDNALARARVLLARLRADARFAELDAAAERYQEVPFTYSEGGVTRSGRIDVLYKDPAGAWQIVDFKTDTIADEATLRRLAADEYGPQVRGYLSAVRRLSGYSARATLCFLDCAGAVRWVSPV